MEIVPEKQVADTPIFLMATAGMRLLPEIQQKALLSEICTYARKTTSFALPDCDLHIQIIPGETEGLYGWIAANYLLGGFDSPEEHAHGKGHHTYGFLDMGGASAQIAFAPNATEAEKHANDLKLLRMRTLDGEPSEYKVFVTTWLGFGVNQARKRYVQALLDASGTHDARELPDPCLPAGLSATIDGEIVTSGTIAHGEEPLLIGTGRFDECLRQTYPLLDKDAPCEDAPCLLNGQHVPAIDFDVNHFVGVSEYWHTTHGVFELSHKEKSYDFNTYQQRVREFCSQEWEDIEEGIEAHKWGKKVDEKIALEVCFKASWLINVLHDGIGIPRVGLEKTPVGFNGTKEVLQHAKDKGFLDPFQAVDKIDDTEVSWTLGKMVLYAAGQVEPRSDSLLPVGFGSNVAGIPTDFQYAGSKYDALPSHDDDDNDDDFDFPDSLLEKASPHTRSTLPLLLLILLVVAYLLRKKDRRTTLYHKLNSFRRNARPRPSSPRKSGTRGFFGGGKLFGRSSTHYERVLEDGGADEFELQDVESDEGEGHSDSSEGSAAARVGRSSGLATPKMGSVSTFDGSASGGAGGSFEVAPTVGLGYANGNSSNGVMSRSASAIGLGITGGNAMDRSGLVVRTESRERLAPGLGLLGAGRRSRTGSPTRKSPLVMGVVSED